MMAKLYGEIDVMDKVKVRRPRCRLQSEVPRVMARERPHDTAIAWVSRFRATNKPSISSLPEDLVTHATTSIESDSRSSTIGRLDEL
jgi:hypothetical protein